MKYLIATTMTLLLFISSQVMADCQGQGYNTPVSADKLSGKRIIAEAPGEEWKEDHCTNGELYKVGAGTSVDPRKKIGTWSIDIANSPAQATYTYDGGSSYSFSLYTNGSEGLCWEDGGGQVAAETVAPPQDVSCP